MPTDHARKQARESLALRILWSLLLACAWQLAELLLVLVVLAQFAHRLLTGVLHGGLLRFGDSLAQFLGQSAAYLSFASDDKPWPFAPWPRSQLSVERDDGAAQ
jgi:hypothetical protein